MIQQIIELELRNDPAGKGNYGARRGDRTHVGIDYCCTPGAVVLTPVGGIVTRLGYPYADDLSWRYVEITSGPDKLRHRFFYVEPGETIDVGTHVGRKTPIGKAQDISERYPDQEMLAHIHYEVKTQAGTHLDPGDLDL
jgi:hypothetical protein